MPGRRQFIEVWYHRNVRHYGVFEPSSERYSHVLQSRMSPYTQIVWSDWLNLLIHTTLVCVAVAKL